METNSAFWISDPVPMTLRHPREFFSIREILALLGSHSNVCNNLRNSNIWYGKKKEGRKANITNIAVNFTPMLGEPRLGRATPWHFRNTSRIGPTTKGQYIFLKILNIIRQLQAVFIGRP